MTPWKYIEPEIYDLSRKDIEFFCEETDQGLQIDKKKLTELMKEKCGEEMTEYTFGLKTSLTLGRVIDCRPKAVVYPGISNVIEILPEWVQVISCRVEVPDDRQNN